MCGISVCMKTDITPFCREDGIEKRLGQSLQAIVHRGPDGQMAWLSDDRRVALGHTRLAITDPTIAGTQPFHDREHGIHAVVAGEFYAYDEDRAVLQREYRFVSQCDSEIVVPLYRKYGLGFLSRLRGEFAICLWDSSAQRLIVARDRYGIKPLFWTKVNDRLLVASEMKAFPALDWRPQWDVRSIRSEAWLYDDRTIFRDVSNVSPGHFIIFEGNHVRKGQYWDMDFPDKRVQESRSEEAMISGLMNRLEQATTLRIPPHFLPGVYLSGGLDSSIVAGIANRVARQRGERLSCLTIAFAEGSGVDESTIAARTVEHLGAKLETVRVGEQDFAAHFEAATYHAEHHNPDFDYVGKYILAERARQMGLRTILTGDGSDEVLGGYRCFLPDYVREPDLSWSDDSLDREEREVRVQWLEGMPTGYLGIQACDHPSQTTSSVQQRHTLNNTSIPWLLWSHIDMPYAAWTSSYGKIDIPRKRSEVADGRILDQMNGSWHPLHTSQYIWTKSMLPSTELAGLSERQDMAHAVEGRLPFLDHELTSYINGLPPSMKIRWDATSQTYQEKYILRQLAKRNGLVTDEVLCRPKQPYTAPYEFSADGPLHQLFVRLITRENVERLGFVSWAATQTMLRAAFDGSHDTFSFRSMLQVAQFVVISQRFRVLPAQKPSIQYESRETLVSSEGCND